MFETVRNAFKIRDLRKKIIYTFLVLIIVRIGCQLPVPGVDATVISEWFSKNNSLDFFNQLTGGSFSQMSIFALNITPYITASIILQLLTIAIPRLEELHKDGEEGRKKIAEYTRYVSIVLAVVESTAMAIGFGNAGYLTEGVSFTSVSVIVVSLTAGSAFLMWLGEQVTEKGVGNGISIILLYNIVSRMPEDMIGLYEKFVSGASNVTNGLLAAIIILAVILGMVVFIIILSSCNRQNPLFCTRSSLYPLFSRALFRTLRRCSISPRRSFRRTFRRVRRLSALENRCRCPKTLLRFFSNVSPLLIGNSEL